MKYTEKINNNKEVNEIIAPFLTRYKIQDLRQALQMYIRLQETYICKTKTIISKVKIQDILFLQITGHHIQIHTEDNIYYKYGSLSQEEKYFSSRNFIRCNQSTIVSLMKIKSIHNNDILLYNGTKLHISRIYVPKVITAFTHFSINYSL